MIEVIGSRVLAPFYGTGLYTWSSLISLTLAALGAGYFLGGRWADRGPRLTRLLACVLGAGVLVLVLPWASPSVLALSSGLDTRLGVLLAAALLFMPPLLPLASISPFAIRLARPSTIHVGSASGAIFA